MRLVIALAIGVVALLLNASPASANYCVAQETGYGTVHFCIPGT